MSTSVPTSLARRRLWRALSWRRTSGQLVAAVLLGVLGFVAAVQLATPSDVLERASRADLVTILDGLATRSDQLEDELARLEQARADLTAGAGDTEAALAEAQARLETLGILAGTLPAEGPGVIVRVIDPSGDVDAASLLSTVQELRDAGAEAIQVDGRPERAVRVVASTSFVDLADGQVSVGGVALARPWEIRAIGDPDTLSTALGIPGGAIASIRSAGGQVSVEESREVLVDALHESTAPTYAQPATPEDTE